MKPASINGSRHFLHFIMEKTDLIKKYKSCYSAKVKPELLEIDAANFLCITGKGDPAGQGFAGKIQALYPVAYAIKFASKAKGRDFAIPKLEGLWWYDEEKFATASVTDAPAIIPRSEWQYRLMIRLPDFIGAANAEEAKEHLKKKRPSPEIEQVTYLEFHEGLSVQVLHKGPFENEPATIGLMHEFMEKLALKRNGLHHEVYLSDFRKTSPEKLKTILRQPVK
jgi:hypothetical protein